MTHMHIPTLPPPRDTVRYVPTHRRLVFNAVREINVARCSGCSVTGQTVFVKTFCPRHDAHAYASHMARHATDSIPVVR